MSQEKLQTMVMQMSWKGNRGVLWDCASSERGKVLNHRNELVPSCRNSQKIPFEQYNRLITDVSPAQARSP